MDNERVLKVLESARDKLNYAYQTNYSDVKDLKIKEAYGELNALITMLGGKKG